MQEVWKDVPQFIGHYQISNFGRLRNVRTNNIIKPFVSNTGYYIYNLWGNGKQNKRLLHRLVAQAFIPNPDNLPEIDHIDGNPKNNSLDNLRWCTHKENSNYEIRRQRLSESHKGEKHVRWGKFGKDNPTSKPVAMYRNNILIRVFNSFTEADKCGYHIRNVYESIKQNKPYKGYMWKRLSKNGTNNIKD